MSTKIAPRGTRGGPRIAGVLVVAAEQVMAELSAEVIGRHPELRAAHLQLFRYGSIDNVRLSELAARTGMTRQSLHELVAHLESHGYLTRRPDPADARAHLIRLRAPGRRLEDEIVAGSARLHLRWRAALGAERFDVVWHALQQVTGLTGGPPAVADLRADAGLAPGDPDH